MPLFVWVGITFLSLASVLCTCISMYIYMSVAQWQSTLLKSSVVVLSFVGGGYCLGHVAHFSIGMLLSKLLCFRQK